MNALDVYSKRNIRDYLARPEEKYDKEYSKERQEIRKYIREDDRKAKEGQNLPWEKIGKNSIFPTLFSKHLVTRNCIF